MVFLALTGVTKVFLLKFGTSRALKSFVNSMTLSYSYNFACFENPRDSVVKEKGSCKVKDLVEQKPPRDIIETREKSGIGFALNAEVGVLGFPHPFTSL